MRNQAPVVLLCLTLAGCPAPGGTLSITAVPNRINDDGATARLQVVATLDNGAHGTGSVKLTSAAGSLSTPMTLTLDSTGRAETDFSCSRLADARCVNSARVVGEWQLSGNTVSGEARVSLTATGGAGGGSAGGSAGGSSGGGAAGGAAGSGGGGMQQGTIVGTGIVLLGFLERGSTTYPAVSVLGAPNQPRAGFANALSAETKLTPAGRLVYSDATTIWEFVEDALRSSTSGMPSQIYPTTPTLNDVYTGASRCTGGDPYSYWYYPDTGMRVQKCGPLGAYVNDTGNVPGLTSSDRLLALGNGGHAFIQFAIVDAAGARANVTGLGGMIIAAVRSKPSGFWVAASVTGTSAPALYDVPFNGAATKVGNYGAPPAGTSALSLDTVTQSALDSNGDLYVFSTVGSDRVVVKFSAPPSTSSAIAYTEAGAVVDWAMSPPRLFNFASGGRLIAPP